MSFVLWKMRHRLITLRLESIIYLGVGRPPG